MRLFGGSVRKGKDSEQISRAITIRLSGLSKGSTVLHLQCQRFSETLQGIQGNLFNQEILNRLPEQNPISLVMESFREALDPESAGDMLDRQLLKDLQAFKKVFVNNTQSILFSNQGSLPELTLNARVFRTLKHLEDQIPQPQRVVISGVVEELKFSKAKVTFIPELGKPFIGFLGEAVSPATMAQLWGQQATIKGVAHFKPNGQMAFVDIQFVQLASPGDLVFSRVPVNETVEQQLQRALRDGKGRGSRFSQYENALAGELWETTLEEDLLLLKG